MHIYILFLCSLILPLFAEKRCKLTIYVNFLSATRKQQHFSCIRQVFNQLHVHSSLKQSLAIFFLENDP